MGDRLRRLATGFLAFVTAMSLVPGTALAETADGLAGIQDEGVSSVNDSGQDGVQGELAVAAGVTEAGGTEAGDTDPLTQQDAVTPLAEAGGIELLDEQDAGVSVTEAVAAVTDAGGNVTYYESLQGAVDAAGSGAVITLVADAAESGVISGDGLFVAADAGKNITIDFNGLTYNVTGSLVGSTGTVNQGFHLEKGNAITLTNGTLTSTTALMVVQNYCDLTLEDFTVDGTQSEQCTYAVSNNFGSLTVKGNSTIQGDENTVAFDVWYGMAETYKDGVSVTFEASDDPSDVITIVGNIEYGAGTWGSAQENW